MPETTRGGGPERAGFSPLDDGRDLRRHHLHMGEGVIHDDDDDDGVGVGVGDVVGVVFRRR